MLRFKSKSFALIPLFLVIGAVASFAEGVVSIVPKSNTAQVGQPITYDVVLQTNQPLSAYMLAVNFTTAGGAEVNNPQFTPNTAWSSASTGGQPIALVSAEDANRLVLQSSLLGQNAQFANPNGTVIGELSVNAAQRGTVIAQIAAADFFTEGLTQPEGTDLGITVSPPGDEVTVGGSFILGDSNGDGRLTIVDALFIAQFLTGLRDSVPNPEAADFNKSGSITIADALQIAQVIAELIPDPNTAPGKVATNVGAINVVSIIAPNAEQPDLNNDGEITILDLLIQAQIDAGLRDPNDPLPTGRSISPAQGVTVDLIADDRAYEVGETVSTRLVANVGNTPLGAYDIVVNYDAAVFSVAGVADGADPLFGAPISNTGTPGRINLAAFQASSFDQPTGSVELAIINFVVSSNAQAASPITLTVNELASTLGDVITTTSTPLNVVIAQQPGETPTPTTTPGAVEPTPTVTETPTVAPGETATPTETPTVAPGETATPTETPTVAPETPTPTITESPTVAPEETPTPTMTESPTVAPEETPTPTMTESPTVAPEETPTPTMTESPTVAPEETPTPIEPTPTPVELTPTPIEPTPTPIELTPTPIELTPTPTVVPGELTVRLVVAPGTYNVGDTITGRLVANVAENEIGGFNVRVFYEGPELEFINAVAGADTGAFEDLTVSTITDGTVRISSTRRVGETGPSGEAELAVLTFTVESTGDGSSAIDLDPVGSSISDPAGNPIPVTFIGAVVDLGVVVGTPTPTVVGTETPTPAVTSTPTVTATPTGPVPPTPTVGPVVIGPSRGLLLLNYNGYLVERGTSSGRRIDLDGTHGALVDIEVYNNQLSIVNTERVLFPSGTGLPSSGGSVTEDILDHEFVGPNRNGSLVLDRYGRVRAFGTAQFMGDTLFTQSVRLGRVHKVTNVPIAADLEVVPDPANPNTNIGYYIVDQKGNFIPFGNVTFLPGIPHGQGPIMAVDLDFDASGNVVGYAALNYLGQIITFNSSTGYTQPTAPLRTEADPYVVDFVRSGGATYIMNELGTVFGPSGTINDPAAFGNAIGRGGFVDIELADNFTFGGITPGGGGGE